MKKSRNAKYSRSLHVAKLRMTFYPSPLAKRIILVIIAFIIALVSAIVIYVSIFTTENQTKWRISQLATDYYENYFYQNLAEGDKTEIVDYLEKYHEKGLPNVTLNVLLSYDGQKNAVYQDFLDESCDRNKTFVRFYPDPPYDKKSYHIEYTYTCNY